MSNAIVASVTRAGTYEPFNLQVSRNQISGHTPIQIFGYGSSVTNSYIPAWEANTAYTYLSTAQQMTVVSTSASDNTSASIVINGLDSNFNPISETLFLNGTTAVTSVNSYLRINGINLASVGTGQTTNVGIITCKYSSTTYAEILAGAGKSQMSIYSVPNGYTFYFVDINIQAGNVYTSSYYLNYRAQVTNNSVSPSITSTVLTTPFVETFTAIKQFPFGFASKSDIQWQFETSNSALTVPVGVIVEGVLIPNNNSVTGVGT